MIAIKGQPLTIPLPQLTSHHTPLHMLWVEPGSFLMGSLPGTLWRNDYVDDLPFHATISQGYWLGQYPVTQAQWRTLIVHDPSPPPSCTNCPVSMISWPMAIAFCELLNALLPDLLPPGYIFSLPTEAQWEYACRAGTQTPFYHGDRVEDLPKVAWYADNSDDHPHPVGEKTPNAWGFHDMLGNVHEWCYDEVAPYPRQPTTDWTTEGDQYCRLRIIRGGSYGSPLYDRILCCTARTEMYARRAVAGQGFRLCARLVYPSMSYQ